MHAALALAFTALPAVMAADFPVTVGAGGKFAFQPEFVNAQAQDTVTFTFAPKNHSVTQSAFDSPCVPLANGFDSGFKSVSPDAGVSPTYTITVTNASVPLWFHCEQIVPFSHCGQGMVFAINPPAEPNPHSFSAFQALAKSLNGTATSTSAASTDTYVTPSSPVWETATATVSSGASTWVTTYTSYAGTPSPTFAATPVNHEVVVGVDGQFAYGPANISASLGDTVTFIFHAKNHTVTRSAFMTPCQRLAVPEGQFSTTGFVGVAVDETNFPRYTFTVNDTAPIWGYCGQTAPVSHCGAGMVFSINAVETGPNNFAAFQALAKRLNGTSSTTPTGTSPGSSTSPSATNGALSGARTNGAALALGLLVVAACFL